MRPSDWSPLSLASDPTPGDPTQVRGGGRRYREVANAIARAASTLRALEAGASQADSVSALLETRDDIVDQISNAEGRYRTVGDALVTYSYTLDRVQADTATALSRARTAQREVDFAERLQRYYRRLAEDANDPDQAEQRAEYRRKENRYRGDASDARGEVESQQQVVAAAVADRDTAAQTAIDQIEQITSSDGLTDSWWDNWGAKLTAWIATIAEAIAAIAGILALLLCWVPILGQALLAIAAIAGIVAALANILLAATGEKSWGEAALSIVFAALGCVGLGGARGVLAALKSGAGFLRGGGLAALGGLKGLAAGTGAFVAAGVRSLGARMMVNAVPSLRQMTGMTVVGSRGVDDIATAALRFNKSTLRPIDGFHDVFCHGSPIAVFGDDGVEMTAKQLADVIRSGTWDGVESIRLVSCQTGGGPFAQELANELGVSVLAPLSDVWSSGSGKTLMESATRVAQLVTRYPL